MGENPRELIRAAQAAELRGDKKQAIDYLKRAAEVYEGAGNFTRSQQMLRHAYRLDESRVDILANLKSIEARMPKTSSEGSEDIGAAVHELHEPERPLRVQEPVRMSFGPEGEAQKNRPTPQRGPTRAAPGLEAWCSFCCRPAMEVGPLVAGPADVFICRGCSDEAVSMLPPAPERSEPKRKPAALESVESTDFFGHSRARDLLDAALRGGARLTLVIGPEADAGDWS
jgi:hypothetical protein